MTHSRAEQLPLPLTLADPWPGFAQYIAGANRAALAALQMRLQAGEQHSPLLLLGASGSGKSHLLGACMRVFGEREQSARLLPLRRLAELDPQTLGLDVHSGQVLLDDIDAVIGQRTWEVALFALSNRLHDARLPLLCSARTALSGLQFALPDLRSRLATAQCAELSLPDDATRRAALRLRANERGLELNDSVLDWLEVHYSRDLERLLSLLEQLDRLSLSRGRRITLPLVRECLALAQPPNQLPST
jgi:DnaA family protein